MRTTSKISQLESEVLHLISIQHTSEEIVHKLFVSEETRKSDRKNIMLKLLVRNVAGMIREGFQQSISSIQQAN